MSCTPSTVAVGEATTCTATVSDTSSGTKIKPTGTVSFTTDGSGSFSPTASCTLPTGGGGSSASCSVTYTSNAVPGGSGKDKITGSYSGDGAHQTSSGSDNVTVTKRSTGTSVSCTPSSVLVGASTTCTVTVTDTDSGTTSTPSGTVAFTSDASGSFSPSASCTLSGSGSSASCSVTYTPSAKGSHEITGSYQGDSKHKTSSDDETVTANGRTTSTSVSCSPSSVAVDASTTCTATVSDTDTGTKVTPTGDVDFSITNGKTGDFSSGGDCTLGGTGTTGVASCSLTYTPGEGGSHDIKGAYEGDSKHKTSDGSDTITAEKRATSTTLSCTPSSVPVGASSSCKATVSDTDSGSKSTPTGEVSFTSDQDGSFSGGGDCTLSQDSPGKASCSVDYTPAKVGSGSHEVTGSYEGDGKHKGSEDVTPAAKGKTTLSVTKRSTSTEVVCSPDTLPVDDSTSCTATVTDTERTGDPITPTGDVTFTTDPANGGFSDSGKCTLSETTAGEASCSVDYTPTVVGNNQKVTGSYGGGENHETSDDDDTVTVTKRSTNTDVSCTPSTLPVDSPTTCTATVDDDDSGTKSTPTGTVNFNHSGPGSGDFTPDDECTLAPTATPNEASCSVTYTPDSVGSSGSHSIDADYGGDAKHSTSDDSTSVTVTKRTTSTSVSCTPASVPIGVETTCTAVVSDTDIGTTSTPTGKVEFETDGSGTFSAGGQCTLDPTAVTGVATCSITYKSDVATVDTITASYKGDAKHETSSDTFTVTIEKRTTSTEVVCSPDTLPVDSLTTCTATVTDTDVGTKVTPGGAVQFTNGGSGKFTPSASCTLAPTATTGVASCRRSYGPGSAQGAKATKRISADYAGDKLHKTSEDDTNLSVTLRATDTSLECVPTSTAAGDPTTCTATVTDNDTGRNSTPSGDVAFESDGPGSFSGGGHCDLGEDHMGVGACSVTYTPSEPGAGVHEIKAVYAGDAKHVPGEDSAQLTVTLTGAFGVLGIQRSSPIRMSSRGLIGVPLSCPAQAGSDCHGTLTVEIGGSGQGSAAAARRRTRLGRRSFSLAAGQTMIARVRLSRQGRQLVQRRGRLSARIVVTLVDASGQTTREQRELLLLAARRR